MKKVILSVLFSVCTIIVWAQCKPSVSFTDDFTGEKIEAWGGKLGSSRSLLRGTSQNLKFHIGISEGKMFAVLNIQYMQKGNDASVNDVDVPKGSKFMLKTEDGIVSFVTNKVEKEKRKFAGHKITAFNLTAELTEEQLQKLIDSPVTMYRVKPEGGETLEGKVGKKKGKKNQKQFKCFLESK